MKQKCREARQDKMNRYLLDTNAFFELVSYLAGKKVRHDEYDYKEVRAGECYISRITELEIISVIGKYGRGEPAQWQNCNRLLSEDGNTMCSQRYFYKGQKPWKKKVCRDMFKLVKEILSGNSPLLNITVLEVIEDIINRAEGFMMLSSKYKFGSHDALIVATSIIHSTKSNILQVVTSDRALLAAMKEEGMHYIVPGVDEEKVG